MTLLRGRMRVFEWAVHARTSLRVGTAVTEFARLCLRLCGRS